MRANKNAEASKLRREQLLAKPQVPKNAVKHDRPFTSFFGRSSTFGTFDYNGGQVNNYSNNRDLESSSVISKTRDVKSLKMIRPSWTVLQSQQRKVSITPYSNKYTGLNESRSFESIKIMDQHVHKMHHNDHGSKCKHKCRSCLRGARNHNWPANKKIKIPSRPRIPKFLKRIPRSKGGL